MHDEELRELQESESWDDDTAEVHPPVKNPRAVVSVSFSREDFERVSEHARSQGKKVSAFIREAALDKTADDRVKPHSGKMTISSGHGGYINQDFTAAGIVRAEIQETTTRDRNR